MEHDGCVGCKYESESVESKYCMGCKQNAIDKYEPMTNADKIRSMSDEELAEFLYGLDHYWDDGQYILIIEDTNLNDGKEDILDWLQSEVKGSE